MSVYAQDDDMFDVPLNDDHCGYKGPDMHSDMEYNQTPSAMSQKHCYNPAQTRISDIINQDDEDEYTFDVEL